MGYLPVTADGNPGNSALPNENRSAASFWAGANIGDDDFAWCVQTEWGLFLHVAVGLYLCVQQQQCAVLCCLSGLKAIF